MECPLCTSKITTVKKVTEFGTIYKCHTCGVTFEAKDGKTEVKV
jgi:DNA-directed RNA polymerase subunit RPC12/RpoP